MNNQFNNRSVGFTNYQKSSGIGVAPSIGFSSSITSSGQIDNNGDPDIVYYNADIINAKTTNPTNILNDPIVSFQEARNIPIIKNSANYEFSIIRFQLNGSGKNLPLMMPQIELGQANIDLTTYTFGMSLTKTISGSAKTFYVSSPIIYYPENATYGTLANGPKPQAPFKEQDVSTDYYFVYSYEHWVNLVNKTFQLIFTNLQTLVTSAGGGTLTSFCPYMTYEPSTGLFNIYYDANSFGNNPSPYGNFQLNSGTGESMRLYSNNNSYGLFSSFNSLYVNTPISYDYSKEVYTGVTGKGNINEPNLYIVENKLNTNIWNPNLYSSFPTLATAYYKMAENFVNTGCIWNPINSIVFTSGQLPVVNEALSTPVKYGNSNIDTTITSSNFTPTIADLAINTRKAEDYSNLIFYEPNGEFKMASMLGGSNGYITNIDIQVFWKNRLDNKLYPIRMFNYSSVSMKMMFRRKNK